MGRENKTEELTGNSIPGYRPIRVLHVDDEPSDLEITRILLKRKAKDTFKVVSVLSAGEALNKLESELFDVIISDYRMPEMDGIKFLENVRNNESLNHIPFILFTGVGGAEIAVDALNKGADRYIPKNGNPIKQGNELARAINELLKVEMSGDTP